MRVTWALVLAGTLSACGPDLDAFSEQDRALIRAMRLEGRPGDLGNEFSSRDDVAAFGQRLFFDDRLADPGPDGRTVACVDCHAPQFAFSDPRKTNVSLGVSINTGRNAMPLTNLGFYRWFAWDGRGDSLWSQVHFAYVAKGTMAGTPQRMMTAVRQRHRQQYEGLFGTLPDVSAPRFAPCAMPASEWPCDPMAKFELQTIYSNVLKALGAYLVRLVSQNAPIDRYATGTDDDALSPAQKRGLRLFIGKAGCVGCHSGPHFSDDDFHALGLAQLGPNVPPVDHGRETGIAEHAMSPFSQLPAQMLGVPTDGLFRTMSLRNVALSPPYFHAGQAATLKDVVWFYNQGGDHAGPNVSPWLVPLGLSDEEQADLVSFLEALTGEPVDAAIACNNDPVPDPSTARGPLCRGGGR